MKLSQFLKNKHNTAVFALIIANIIWGGASPIFKLALENIPPFTLAFIRFFGASLVLLPFAISDLWIAKKDWSKLFLLTLFGVTFHISFFFLGLRMAPSINAPIILSSGPIFLYIFAILAYKEKIKKQMLIGTLISLAGVLVIIGQPLVDKSLNVQIFGNILFLLSTLGFVGHALFSKEILTRYKAEVITFWSFLIGSLTFLPLFIQESIILHPFETIDARGWIGIVFGIFFSSATAYYLYEYGIKHLDTQEVGIFTYIDPVTTAILANILLGEKITEIFLFGSIFVFVGIFIAEGRIHWHPLHKFKR